MAASAGGGARSRPRPRLTAGGWAAVVASVLLLGLGAVLGYIELTILGVALLAALVLALGLVVVPSTLEVDRHVEPSRVARGDLALGLVHVVNPGRRPAPALLATDRVGGLPVEVALPRLAGGARRTTTYRLPTGRRGIVAVGPLLVEQVDPLGLVRAASPRGQTTSFVVHPRVLPLVGVLAGRSRSLEGPTSDTAPRGTVTFHALREYVVGDDLRHVHWRSTARTGTMMVKEHVDTSQPETVVVLDSQPGRWDETGDAFEEAVDVVASLAVACVRLGFPIRIVTTDGGRVGGRRSIRDAGPLLDHLAVVERRGGAGLPTTCAGLVRERAGDSAIVVTGTATQEDLRAIGALRRRFQQVALVSLRPDAVAVPTLRLTGVTTVDADTAEAFAVGWARALA